MRPALVRRWPRTRGDAPLLYSTHPVHRCTTGVEDVAGNAAMLENLVEAAEAGAKACEHVHLVEGTKWYGMHIGRCATTDPRGRSAPHAAELLLCPGGSPPRRRQRGKRWTWSASRPGFLYDFAPERPRNLVPMIGAWAAMCRELGTPLDFPGKPCYDALFEATDASQLAAHQMDGDGADRRAIRRST